MQVMKKRGIGKLNPEYKLVDVYKQYVKDNTITQFESSFSDKTKLVLPYKEYREIIEDYCKSIVEFIVEESGIFSMPLRMGDLRVEKKKMSISSLSHYKKLKLDYKIYNQTGKKVYHLNEHRRGYRYQIKWNKQKSGPVVNKKIYKFIPTRTTNRRLAWILKNDFTKDYFEI